MRLGGPRADPNRAPVPIAAGHAAPTSRQPALAGGASMATRTETAIPRADVVGSLLRPDYLREARRGVRAGTVSEAELRAAEDRAVLEAIALQEGAGLDAVTDGEYRRPSWV